MKTILYIFVTISVIVTIVTCTPSPKTYTTEVRVLKDITEIQSVNPDSQAVISMCDFSGDKRWNGATFHYSEISDVSYTHFSEAKISTAKMWLSNELERDAEIKNFKNEVSKILRVAINNINGKNNSSIYLPIAHELNELARSKAQRRVLVIYSDLMENTIDISFYNKKQFQMLTSDTDSILKTLEQLQAIQNLDGIEVYLIYQPTDSQSDKVFTVVSEFYKKLLENKGAKVNISANL